MARAATRKRRTLKIRSGDHVKVIAGQGPRQDRPVLRVEPDAASASTSRA